MKNKKQSVEEFKNELKAKIDEFADAIDPAHYKTAMRSVVSIVYTPIRKRYKDEAKEHYGKIIADLRAEIERLKEER